MKLHPRFTIPVAAPQEISYSPEDHKITVHGEALRKLAKLAKKAGLSKREYLNRMLRNKLTDPEYVDQIILEHHATGAPHVISLITEAVIRQMEEGGL